MCISGSCVLNRIMFLSICLVCLIKVQQQWWPRGPFLLIDGSLDLVGCNSPHLRPGHLKSLCVPRRWLRSRQRFLNPCISQLGSWYHGTALRRRKNNDSNEGQIAAES